MQRAVLLSVALLAGCNTYPSDPGRRADFHVDRAKAFFAKSQAPMAAAQIHSALKQRDGVPQVRALLSQNGPIKSQFLTYLNDQIAKMSTVSKVEDIAAALKEINDADIFSPGEENSLSASFDAAVIAANQSGSIPFMIDSVSAKVPALEAPEQKLKVFERTIAAHQDLSYVQRDIPGLLAYVRQSGQGSQQFARLRAALPSMNIRADELGALNEFDPEFIGQRRKQVTMRAHLVVKNSDRIFIDDMNSELSKVIRGVTWVDSPTKDDLEIVIEKVRSNEREIPEQSRTITYSTGQVDFVGALLLMPRNASYQYELKTGGAEIEYGYVVTAFKNGARISEKVLRGKVGGAATRCENARIVNVFGGVTSADFMANNDMRNACAGAPKLSVEQLRAQVLEKISSEVHAIPDITAVTTLN